MNDLRHWIVGLAVMALAGTASGESHNTGVEGWPFGNSSYRIPPRIPDPPTPETTPTPSENPAESTGVAPMASSIVSYPRIQSMSQGMLELRDTLISGPGFSSNTNVLSPTSGTTALSPDFFSMPTRGREGVGVKEWP